MPKTLSTWERKLIDVTLQFANADTPNRRLYSAVKWGKSGRTWLTDLGHDEQEVQSDARRWLHETVDGAGRRGRVAAEISANLRSVRSLLSLTKDGHVRHEYLPIGLRAAVALGCALLLDDRYGLRSHLGQCKARGCAKFFIGSGNGRPGSWCKPAHKVPAQSALNLARVMKHNALASGKKRR